MRSASFFAVLLALFLAAGCSKGSAPGTDAAVPEAKPHLDIRYFHRTVRCPSCMHIEVLAKQAVEQAFAGELSSGRATWASVNLDEPGNARYEKDYKLNAQSVVVSDWRDGRETRWKNLDKVWDLLYDDAAFTDYVQKEVLAWLNDAQAASLPPGDNTK